MYNMTKEEKIMRTQEEVRELLMRELENGVKQSYIARNIGVPKQILSAFKLHKKNLYPESLAKLETFLTNRLQSEI